MALLIYSAITSLDGYVADDAGNFEWAVPDEETHRFINDLERPIGTYLFGRRMYEVMSAWETVNADPSTVAGDFANIWRSAEKIVYSTTLQASSTEKTRIERRFDPQAAIDLKSRSARDISIGGPHLAAHAIRAGIVDEYRRFIAPVIVGNGNRWLPQKAHVELDLLEERRFSGGFAYLRYRARR